jgi:hypothetical protein
MINLQSIFKEVNSYRESLSIQVQKYIGDQDVEKQIVDEKCDAASDDEQVDDEQVFHKTSAQHQRKIRPDQLWAFLISKSTTSCNEMTKLVSYVYSIPCSNAFTEGVFSHMKHSWTASRNSMLTETVAAESKIRLNCKMKCSEFLKFVQNEPELLKRARSEQKYSHKRKTFSS